MSFMDALKNEIVALVKAELEPVYKFVADFVKKEIALHLAAAHAGDVVKSIEHVPAVVLAARSVTESGVIGETVDAFGRPLDHSGGTAPVVPAAALPHAGSPVDHSGGRPIE